MSECSQSSTEGQSSARSALPLLPHPLWRAEAPQSVERALSAKNERHGKETNEVFSYVMSECSPLGSPLLPGYIRLVAAAA